MENTKAYLAKIHWILVTALVYAVLVVFFQPWLYKQFEQSSLIIPIISIAVFTSIFYVSLGIVTSRWKEAAIAFLLSVCIELLYNLLPQSFNSFKPTLFSSCILFLSCYLFTCCQDAKTSCLQPISLSWEYRLSIC